MISTPTNVYPNGQCVEGNDFFKMYSIYYGDNCLAAQVNIYDYDTMEMYNSHAQFEGRDGIHNGDELSTWSPLKLAPKKEYLWNYRFWEKVDIENGYYPSTLKMGVISVPNPVVAVTVGSKNPDITITPTETEFPLSDYTVGVGYLKLPYYVYWEGHGRRVVTAYKKSTNSIVVDEAFAKDTTGSFPPIGTKLYLSNIKTDNFQKLIEESEVNNTAENAKSPIFIQPDLDIEWITHSITTQGKVYNFYDSYLKRIASGKYYPVKRYYPLTGKIEFATETEDMMLGTCWIYSAFVDSPYYYFQTKNVPAITPTVELNNNMFLYYDASIEHEGDYSVDYYYWEICCNGELVKQTKKIYNGRLNYVFREVKVGETYTAKVTLKTKDGMTATSSEISFSVPEGEESRCHNFRAKAIDDLNAVKLTWSNSGATYCHNIYRKDIATNKIIYLGTLYTAKNGAERITEFYDYTCENHCEYSYIMRPAGNGVMLEEVESNSVITDFSDWAIYFLDELPYTYLSFFEEGDSFAFHNANILTMHDDKRYTISSTWKVQINPKIDSVEHNMGRDAKETYYHKPVVTYGETRYDSFPLEFTIGEFSCTTENLEGMDIATFKRWLAEIDSKKPVLIKDSKGFVWFGHITKHSYSTDYTVDDGMITVQLEFVQTADNENVRILKDEKGVM